MRAIFLSAALLLPGQVLAQPVIDSLSSGTVPTSGRFEIVGSGFGSRPLAAGTHVEIGGVEAATARWADDRITAYASAGIPLGDATVRVVTDDGPSNDVALEVTERAPADGAIAWTFVGDGGGTEYPPAFGPDGTLYASDGQGFIYAIDSDGSLQWIRHGPSDGARDGWKDGFGSQGPVVVGADGTIYVVVDLLGPYTQLHAYRPDGSLAWVHTEENYFSHGPAIGPDGNVYFGVRGQTGGLRVVAPDGRLVARNDEPVSYDVPRFSGDIAFGPSVSGGAIDRIYLGSDQPVPNENTWGSLRAYRPDGSLVWTKNSCDSLNSAHEYRSFNVAMTPSGNVLQTGFRMGELLSLHAFDTDGERAWRYPEELAPIDPLTEPSVAPDGTAYVVNQIHELLAIREDGVRRWGRSFDGYIRMRPTVQPGGDRVVVIRETDAGVALRTVHADGRLGWEIELPQVDGVMADPSTPVVFSADGGRAYLSGTLAGTQWALFAVDAPNDPVEGGGGGTGGTGGSGGSGGGAGSGTDPEPGAGDGGDDTRGSDVGCSAAAGGPGFGMLLLGLGLARRRR